MRNQDRFRGCLIGGAAGDALGYAVEFMREGKIFEKYGKTGITEYELTDGVAEISDDTQMTLFTAAGLLAGTARGCGGKYAGYIHRSYVDWLQTQEKYFPLPAGDHCSWLVNVPELFDRRAPGNTCLQALGSGKCGTVEDPINTSKGCGGVMRTAPAGLYFCGRDVPAETASRVGAEAAAVTHGHPLGWLPGAALAQIVYEIGGNGESVYGAVTKTLEMQEKIWPDVKGMDYFLALMRRAVDLAATDTEDLEAIHRLGEGWVGEEALAVAVYCALKYENDFDRAMIVSVNHKGDSDSTGAVAGNILGTKTGLGGIPEKYLKNLELKDLILEIADDLYFDGPSAGWDAAVWKQKYVEASWPGIAG